MKVNVKELLRDAGVKEEFYPGKRLVKACRHEGEFKSHSVVFDWRNPDKIRLDVKAGLSGRTLDAKKLKNYPVSYQSPTYVEIDVVNDNEDKEDEEEKGSAKGKGGSSGGQKPKKKLADIQNMANAFGEIAQGKIPELGQITEMVVMGMEIAAEAYAAVLETLTHQIDHAKITTTELLSQAGEFVTKYMPPSFLEPTGDEKETYKYDREKNADIGFKMSLG